MGHAERVMVAGLALGVGLVLAFVGLDVMLSSGPFASAEHESSSGLLGLGGGSSSQAEVNVLPFVGLFLALVGAAAFLFGLRALFVASDGGDA